MTERPTRITYAEQDIRKPTKEQGVLLDAQLDALAALALSPAALEAGFRGPATVDRVTIAETDQAGKDMRLVSWRGSPYYETFCIFMGQNQPLTERYFVTATETSSQFQIDALASHMGRQAIYYAHLAVNKGENKGVRIQDVTFDFPRMARKHHAQAADKEQTPTRRTMRIGLTQPQMASQLLRIGSYTAQAALQMHESPLQPAVSPEYRMASSLLGMMCAQADRKDQTEWVSGVVAPRHPLRSGVVFEDGTDFVALHQPVDTLPLIALTVMPKQADAQLAPSGTQYRIGPELMTMEPALLPYVPTREFASRNLGAFQGEGVLAPEIIEREVQDRLSGLIMRHAIGPREA